MNLSAFEILSISVHHLNNEVGAGYPKPSSRTQKVSLVGGLRRFVSIGKPMFFAAFSILSRFRVILSAICGASTRVLEEIT